MASILQVPEEDSTERPRIDYSAIHLYNTRMEDRIINKTFTYCSLSAGFGLVVVGSILTYIFNDQARYSRDPFRGGLQATAILFIIIGLLLTTTSLIKLFLPAFTRGHNLPGCKDCCFLNDEPYESAVKSFPHTRENTIVYNPYYPPVLIPYMSGTYFAGKNLSDPSLLEFPFSFLPGTLLFDDQTSEKEHVQTMNNENNKNNENENASTPDAHLKQEKKENYLESREEVISLQEQSPLANKDNETIQANEKF